MKPNRLLFYSVLPALLSVLSVTNSLAAPTIGGCTILPADNVWNTPIDTLPVHQKSSAWVTSIGNATSLRMDFAAGKWEGSAIGIPYNIVSASKEPKQAFTFLYDDESDAGPYPISATSLIEEGSDHHLITLDKELCKLYEVAYAVNTATGWTGVSGAVWDLKTNALRPVGWTSADAAGLPMLPGLVRYDEVESGVISHAIRFTVQSTNSYIWPGTHRTSGQAGILTNQTPMGARFRLKADYDISKFDPKMQVILKAMKTYGIINADNGSNWFVSGVPDPRWNDELLASLKTIKGIAFEAVDESCLMVSSDSGKADLSKCAAISKDRSLATTATPLPNVAGCDMFPADNVWNTPIDSLPVHANSAGWVANIGGGTSFHMDFASGQWEGKAIGIPYNAVNASKETKSIFSFLYSDESDAGPYPTGTSVKIEEGSDHHLITLDKEACKLYEVAYAVNTANGWTGVSGAVWDLKSNAMRPIGWTSADAAGLPILPGLVRYDEIEAGAINHALRFTVGQTNSYIWPGSHLTDGVPQKLNAFKPPFGARFRLKASYDISAFDPKLQVILKAMKTYGIINADNGGSWFVSGVPDSRWNDDMLSLLDRVKGSAFEAVDESCLMVSVDSAKADLSNCGVTPKERVVTPPTVAATPATPTCTYSLSMDAKSFAAKGGIDNVNVQAGSANASSCTWSAKSNTSWLPIYAQAEKNRVVFAISRNKSGTARSGTITIAGKTFTVTQSQ